MRQFCVAVLLCLGCVQARADIKVIEEIIAKVNGDIITRGDIDRSRSQLMEEAKKAKDVSTADVQQAERDILRKRIDELLLQQKGKELNINVDSEVTRYINDLRRRAKIADDTAWAEYVRQQTGSSVEDFKNEVKNNMLQQRVISQEVMRQINIPEAELKAYYEKHQAEMKREEELYLQEIFLSTDNKTPAEIAAIEKKAKDLAGRGKKGEKFGDLARDNSDSSSRDEEGRIPPYKKGQLSAQLESMVWEKPRNFVTEPVKLPNGWLILKVEEHSKAGVPTYEEAKQDITSRLGGERMQPKLREYLTKLREDAFLEIKDGYVDTGAAPNKNTKWQDPAKLVPETVKAADVRSQKRRKKMLGMVPIPGTSKSGASAVREEAGTSSSKPLGPK